MSLCSVYVVPRIWHIVGFIQLCNQTVKNFLSCACFNTVLANANYVCRVWTHSMGGFINNWWCHLKNFFKRLIHLFSYWYSLFYIPRALIFVCFQNVSFFLLYFSSPICHLYPQPAAGRGRWLPLPEPGSAWGFCLWKWSSTFQKCFLSISLLGLDILIQSALRWLLL